MLGAGLCFVTGFEPGREALLELQTKSGPNERYLPFALGDGSSQTLKVCPAPGAMTSLLEPDALTQGLFSLFDRFGRVIERVPLDTQRLDDIREIEHLDLLKIDIQGGELAVFQNGRSKLAEAVAIQTEVSFITVYQDQPPFGEVDLELRRQGFVPHCFPGDVKKWVIGDFAVGDPFRPLNQILETDIVYVRDFVHPDGMTDEQLKQLAMIAHYCYGSFDLALRCVRLLEDRHAVDAGSSRRYLQLCKRTVGYKRAIWWAQYGAARLKYRLRTRANPVASADGPT
ncbi:FkbM family methyltransferase [Mycobacterium kansasii]|nr:FkbM family methyltransferase [Mycobacterium kansasii]POX99846.1 FkbM family methyltransferase [Mycobacterium kansasii]POY08104.1 FkbM family methyltransferase [Mycobacterium kansasii]POY23832.1 FkbM family methyltransferase [Mycobacterium kansasii]POY27828.1 FkbM family methyltransferase [Mycobacterium kansasii]